MIRRMRNREMNVDGSAVFEYCCGLARDPQARHAVFVGHVLDILPGQPAAPAGFERLEASLLGGKSPCIRLRSRDSLTIAKCPLLGGKHALGETRSSGDRLAYTIDFNNVDSDGKDHK